MHTKKLFIKRIHLITNIDDLKTIDPTKKYVMTNQTTMSLYDVYDLCEKAKEILQNAGWKYEYGLWQKEIDGVTKTINIDFVALSLASKTKS